MKSASSAYIGIESVYRGSLTKVVEFDNGWARSTAKFWCRVLDDKNRHFKRGEEFTLSANTVYKNFKKELSNGEV